MVKIKVDKNTCRKDGKCVEICPIGLLQMNAEKLPEFIPGGGEICINCGHCFAFCPVGAIELSTMSPKDAFKLDYGKMPSAEQTELLLKGRRSIRAYKDEPLAKEAIEKLLDIARYAPSGINRQPVNWLVLNGKDKVHQLSAAIAKWMEGLVNEKSPMAESFNFGRLVDAWGKGDDKICRSAPCVVIAYGVKDDPIVPQSCTIAAEYLELAAFGLGLGACWAGYVQIGLSMSEEVRKSAGLPSRAASGAAMLCGHPKFRYSCIPLRNPAKVAWK